MRNGIASVLERRKGFLESVTNVAVLVAALLVTAYFGFQFLRPDSAQRPDGPNAGVRLTAPGDYDFASNQQTLILALRTDCSHCEANLPLYKELISSADETDCGHGVVAVFPNDSKSISDFQRVHEFWPKALENVPLASLGVTATPTLVLVDKEGTVQNVWVGELRPEQQREILDIFEPQSVCSG